MSVSHRGESMVSFAGASAVSGVGEWLGGTHSFIRMHSAPCEGTTYEGKRGAKHMIVMSRMSNGFARFATQGHPLGWHFRFLAQPGRYCNEPTSKSEGAETMSDPRSHATSPRHPVPF
jgi:hypothetical protein